MATKSTGGIPGTLAEDARWNTDRQAVEFGVEIGEYDGVVRVSRGVFQRLLPARPTPERCGEAYYLQQTRFESIVGRKQRRRQLTEDGNVEITGRDVRELQDVSKRNGPTKAANATRDPLSRATRQTGARTHSLGELFLVQV